MAAVILSTFILIFSSQAWADGFDATVGGGYRSFPVGGSADLELGYGKVFWGSETDPLYGFFRIAGLAEGVVDHLTAGGYIEVFPVSIFGLRGGRTVTQSYLKYDDYDCNLYLCKGDRSEGFTEAALYLGGWRLKFAGTF